jgi:sugar phosphate isomerase/epimerase
VVSYTADDWPITAALLQFPALLPDGTNVQDAGASVWTATFREVADAGFANVDLTDSWVRPGDLSTTRLDELSAAAAAAGVGIPAISSIRRSVIDAAHGADYLAYAHRTIDAAAHLGIRMVSFGLHQALTPAQSEQLWFWTVEGHRDPDDRDLWNLAVERFRELGKHAAEVGVILSLEMYEDTYLGTADSAVQLVTDIGLHNVGINPDVGNLVRLHRPIENWRDILRKVLPYTNYWHVKNYFRDEDASAGSYVALPAPLELGIINYREAVALAISMGFQGMICTEHYGGDGLSVSATNQRYLRSMVLPKRPYSAPASLVAQTGSPS